jgi:hypothetical protein
MNGWTLGPIQDPDSPAGRLAQVLRELTDTAGVGSLRAFAKRANCGPTTISDALSGKPQLVPTMTVIEAICTVCGADEPTLARLRVMRTEAINSRLTEPTADGPPPSRSAASDESPPGPAVGDPSPLGPALRRRLLVRLLVGLVGLVAVGLVGWWQFWPHDCGGAFSGIQLNDNTDGECIGITDGGYLFNDPSKTANSEDRNVIERIDDVQRRIEAENNSVAATDRYVKVVFLGPLTVSQARPAAFTLKQILHSLQGSYTALYRANHSSDFGDQSAGKLQLLLANQGSRQDADPDFLNGIAKASEPDHPVVAVFGLGSSVPNTKTAVEYLAKQGIPMVNAAASADSLTHLPLLWSSTPSNTEYATHLKFFFDHQTALRSGIIVYDRNPDLFTQSLTQAYHDQLGRYITFPDQPFQGSTLDIRAVPDVFFPVVTNLCNAANDPRAPLDMVFFAGRVTDFGAFTAALKARTCVQRPLTVVIVAIAAADAQAYANTLTSSNVKVVAATSADSASWGRNEPGTPEGYPAFLAAYHDRGFVDDADLIDSYAIAHHDALATVAQAIRLASLGTQTHAPNPEDVAGQFGRLNLAYVVRAASGTLSFPSEGGRATGRPILIKQIG